jgi:phenylpropionate dioxygenase-like ring-hydroxylating dioxygenase large terminal subunit
MPFITDDRNMLDEWLTVGPESALRDASAAAPKSARLLGETLALGRDAEGAIQCRLAEQPLAAQSRYGFVWVCPGGTPARPLFAFPEYAQPGRRLVDCGGIGVAVSGLRVIENFLDMAHFPFVHPDYLGKVPHTEVRDYKVETDAASGEIVATECRFWQPKSSAVSNDGSEVVYKYRVMQPFSAMLYKSAFGRPDELDAIGLFVQPLEEERVIVHCLLAYFDDVSSTTELIAFQQTIFGQDKPILENHALKRLPLEGRVETPTRADLTSVLYRRWLAARGMRFGVHPAPAAGVSA